MGEGNDEDWQINDYYFRLILAIEGVESESSWENSDRLAEDSDKLDF